MIIYRLTFINGKSYVGQTVRELEVRIATHGQAARANSLLPVHCAWRKHGAPTVEVLSRHETMEDLHAAEIAAIKACGTLAPGGYNVGFGGETAPSKNPDVAAKIAAKATGRKASDATKAAMSKASRAKWENPDYRAKVYDAVVAGWTPQKRAAAANRAAGRVGERRSDETRAKISAKASNMSAETRAKMSASAKARVREPRLQSTCDKISENTKKAWADPDVTARRMAAIAATKASPEGRARASAAAKARWATRHQLLAKGTAK